MTALVITGRRLVGKTTLRRALCENHSFWSPTTFTTRALRKNDFLTEHMDREAVTEGIRANDLVFPVSYAGSLYAWKRTDFHRLIEGHDIRAVVDVRPYTAMVLRAIVPTLQCLWLWAEPAELEERIKTREIGGSSDEYLRDEEATAYEDFFELRLRSSPNMAESALELLS